MSAPWIHDGRLISAHDAERLLGSKAARLIRLVDAGQSVPKFYCIKTEAFRHAVESDAGSPSLGQLLQSLASLCDGAELDRCASEIRARLFNIPLTHDLQLEIASSQERCFPNRAAVAVRSSVCGEDGDGHSFAGMHDTVLAVNDPFGLFDAIRRVWASAFSDRAIAYRRECGLPCTEIAPAVMVQEMIDARQSGVLFTCNPVTGNVNEIIASAVPGLGEELVRGECSSDSYVIDKQSRHVQPQLAVKHEKLIVSGNENGVERVLLDEREQSAGTLTDEQLGLIADLAISVEAHFGRPQDIEFCFDASGRLYLLQSRPVVNVDEYGPAAGNSLVWDNSNIIESYSGVTSPMTFSFIRRAYAIVYHCFAEVMGIPPRVVREHRGEFENMLGLFRGRVYYNLRNWYRLVQLFPGYQYNSRFMETMM
ncbi:MAG: PEP/pyruvate-binding domain-containing protein, partial [Planctomycetaceae bacterium]